MKEFGGDLMSKIPLKQRKAMIIKIYGAVMAFIIAIINMFISGFQEMN
jgi:hypothetical protein